MTMMMMMSQQDDDDVIEEDDVGSWDNQAGMLSQLGTHGGEGLAAPRVFL